MTAGSVMPDAANSEAFVPENVIAPAGIVGFAVPTFWMVNVRASVPPVTVAEPKLVWSAVSGVVLPSAMFVALPVRLISAAPGPGPTELRS